MGSVFRSSYIKKFCSSSIFLNSAQVFVIWLYARLYFCSKCST